MSDPFTLAVIPARGGSKRIPRKNIRLFAGKPILAYSILAAQGAGCFCDVVVSTDDQEVASVARSFGSSVPFMRSKETSNDRSGLADVLKEVVTVYEQWSGRKVDLVCCILATAPFVTADSLRQGQKMMADSKIDAVLTIAKYSYHIQRALRVDKEYVSMIWPENYIKRSQELEPSYHDAGQFYWIKKDKLFEYGKLFIPRCGFICIDEMHVQDIDTEDDWRCAQEKYALLESKERR